MLSPNTSCGTPATLRQAVRGVHLGYIRRCAASPRRAYWSQPLTRSLPEINALTALGHRRFCKDLCRSPEEISISEPRRNHRNGQPYECDDHTSRSASRQICQSRGRNSMLGHYFLWDQPYYQQNAER